MKKEIQFSLLYRDMFQSSGKFQPSKDQLERIAPVIIDMGCFDRVETNGGAFEQVNLMYGENPNLAVRAFTKPFNEAGIKTHMLDRGLNALRMYPCPVDVRKLMYKVKHAQGVDITRIFDGLNDARATADLYRAIRDKGLSMDEIIHHLAVFISRLWQIHVFGEGNTRTTAVFFIKYLRTLGFDVTNDIFAENAWYFRNSLVRANYNDLKNGIHETTEYLELFLRNLLLNEDHPLHNRTLHISGMFKEMEKPDIGAAKPDIEKFKADIEELFQPKTTSHILKLREAFPGQSIFGRSDVMSVIEIKPSRASDLLKDMAEHGIIEPVTGHGKGKYRFKEVAAGSFPRISTANSLLI